MFGAAYFGKPQYGRSYWGPAAVIPPPPPAPTPSAGGAINGGGKGMPGVFGGKYKGGDPGGPIDHGGESDIIAQNNKVMMAIIKRFLQGLDS